MYEDLVIVEPVDQSGAPVPLGTVGTSLLVTVLFSRTLPLIRYEMSDRVGIGAPGCPCGRSFALLQAVEGRVEDVLLLPGRQGPVSVHPNVFHSVLDEATVAGWQVIQEPSALRVLLAGLAKGVPVELIRSKLAAGLTSSGVVGMQLDIHVVESIERTALGKAPLVRGLPRRS